MKQQQAVRTGWSGKEPSSRGLQRPAVKRCCFPSAFHIFRRHLWRTLTWNHRERKVGSILLLQFEYVKVGSDHCSVLSHSWGASSVSSSSLFALNWEHCSLVCYTFLLHAYLHLALSVGFHKIMEMFIRSSFWFTSARYPWDSSQDMMISQLGAPTHKKIIILDHKHALNETQGFKISVETASCSSPWVHD